MKKIIKNAMSYITGKESGEKEELFCKVFTQNEKEWSYGIITRLNLEDKQVTVFIALEYLEKLFKEGDKVIIKSLKDDYKVNITGTIRQRVVSLLEQSITVEIDNVKDYINFRQHERFKVNSSAVIKDDNGNVPAILEDISLGGCLLFSEAQFGDNECIDIDILGPNGRSFSFSGKISRKTQHSSGYKYAIQIEDMDESSKEMFSVFIEFLALQKKHTKGELDLVKKSNYSTSMLLHRRRI